MDFSNKLEKIITKIIQISILFGFACYLFYGLLLLTMGLNILSLENYPKIVIYSTYFGNILLFTVLFFFGLWIILGMFYQWESYLTRPISKVEANGIVGKVMILFAGMLLMLPSFFGLVDLILKSV